MRGARLRFKICEGQGLARPHPVSGDRAGVTTPHEHPTYTHGTCERCHFDEQLRAAESNDAQREQQNQLPPLPRLDAAWGRRLAQRSCVAPARKDKIAAAGLRVRSCFLTRESLRAGAYTCVPGRHRRGATEARGLLRRRLRVVAVDSTMPVGSIKVLSDDEVGKVHLSCERGCEQPNHGEPAGVSADRSADQLSSCEEASVHESRLPAPSARALAEVPSIPAVCVRLPAGQLSAATCAQR